jgi:hypothetical protein
MKVLKVLGIAVGFGAALASPQTPQTDVAIAQLQKSNPEVTWKSKSAIVADVTCDGRLDTVVFGSEKSEVVVAVVPGGQPNKTQVFRFPIVRDKEDGFYAPPTRIRTAPLNCDTEGGPLEGCKPAKGCQEFAVDDDGCDPFNFYWDSSQRKIQWWRE